MRERDSGQQGAVQNQYQVHFFLLPGALGLQCYLSSWTNRAARRHLLGHTFTGAPRRSQSRHLRQAYRRGWTNAQIQFYTLGIQPLANSVFPQDTCFCQAAAAIMGQRALLPKCGPQTSSFLLELVRTAETQVLPQTY